MCSTSEIYGAIPSHYSVAKGWEGFCASAKGVVGTLGGVENKAYKDWGIVSSYLYVTFSGGLLVSFYLNYILVWYSCHHELQSSLFHLFFLFCSLINLSCSVILSRCHYLLCVSHALNESKNPCKNEKQNPWPLATCWEDADFI